MHAPASARAAPTASARAVRGKRASAIGCWGWELSKSAAGLIVRDPTSSEAVTIRHARTSVTASARQGRRAGPGVATRAGSAATASVVLTRP